MKYALLLSILFLMFACANNSGKDQVKTDDSTLVTDITDSLNNDSKNISDTATKLFKGAWFDIRYPSTFTAIPSLHSTTHREEYESVFFSSPDDAVSFYVFSPQWSGDGSDIKINAGEKIISKDSSYNEEKKAKTINWTIEANDKSYRRSYQEIKMDENVNWIFGFKYKDEAAYNKYKEQYLRFKNSIKQYAD